MADAKKGASKLDEEAARKPRIFGPADKFDQLAELWRKGLPPGDKTGWRTIDAHYTVAPGQFTVITGWPGSGKSEWLDALLINLSRQGWRFALFSPENMPVELHIAKLMEKLSGKPFGAGPSKRLEFDELPEYVDELQERFRFLETGTDSVTAGEVIACAQPYFDELPQECRKGLVIDPWNELEHWRPPNMSETEYVSHTLSTVRNWARKNNVHVWIVAHPQKMRREDGKLPVPRPDMISGSSHWWNKADCAISVWRNLEDPDSRTTDVYIQKVRFKHIGRAGVVSLEYDRVTGRYSEPPPSLEMYQRTKDGE